MIESFKNAVRGIQYVLLNEKNARTHLLITLMVMSASLLFHVAVPELALSSEEFAAVIFAATLVFLAEVINTAIERVSDLVHPRKNESIRVVKDITAAAVLTASFGAALVGLLVFLPRFVQLITLLS